MRLLLDAHVSGRAIASVLRDDGHDVRALSDEPQLGGIDDDAVLEPAATEARILVTHDVSDFPAILREWAEAGRSHSGCVLIYGIGSHEFGVALERLRQLFAERPRQADWADRVVALTRASAE